MIKSKWAEKLRLRLPDLGKQFVLESDASDIGIGAVLKQGDEIVACFSRVLTPTERNYGITEREFLAGLSAMEKWAFYLSYQKI